MNIFKVLASGKRNFHEDQMSAVLAWFLHPNMEHGLGYEFLNRFLSNILDNSIKSSSTNEQAKSMRGSNKDEYYIELEDHVEDEKGAYIDIVFHTDEYCIGIENKINPLAPPDLGQLNREYTGLIKKYPDKRCLLIFLVPLGETGELTSPIKRAYEAFNKTLLRENEYMKMMTWQQNDDDIPCIIKIIESILHDESLGYIEPINDYTRHTIKAWSAFIRNNFGGYIYEHKTQPYTTQPKADIESLYAMDGIYVGIQGGLSKLVMMPVEDFRKRSFAFTNNNMSSKPNWLNIRDFKQIIDWKINDIAPDIFWPTYRYTSQVIYHVVKDCCPPQKIFIGIQGGEKALREMDVETIYSKKWQMETANKPRHSQWVPGKQVWEILDEKGFMLLFEDDE